MSAKRKEDNLKCNKEERMNKNFMYRNLKRSNCYGTAFAGSNFSYASLRGAHFKSCDFFGCTFEWTEFIGTNLKKSKFKGSKFENTIFEGVNLDGTDFKDATFKNVIFVDTNIESAKNLNISEDTKIFEEMPELNISKELEEAIENARANEFVKKSRTLDIKDGTISPISTLILLEEFSEKNLISGLNILANKLDKEFHTLSYIIKAIKGYSKEGLL